MLPALSTRIRGVIDRLESRLRKDRVLGGRFRKFYVCQREALERLLEKVTGDDVPISGIVQMPTGREDLICRRSNPSAKRIKEVRQRHPIPSAAQYSKRADNQYLQRSS